MPNIQEKIEEFREAMSHKNCISCICCQRAHQNFPRLAESIAQQAVHEERMRILSELPEVFKTQIIGCSSVRDTISKTNN